MKSKVLHSVLFSVVLFLVVCTSFAQAATSSTVTGHYIAPTVNTDGSAITGTITYNLYQAAQGSTLVKVQTGIAGTSFVVSTGIPAGTTQCFALTAVVNSVESAQTAQACIAIPNPTPNAPSNLVVVFVAAGS